MRYIVVSEYSHICRMYVHAHNIILYTYGYYIIIIVVYRELHTFRFIHKTRCTECIAYIRKHSV